jgi:hypothetical protein
LSTLGSDTLPGLPNAAVLSVVGYSDGVSIVDGCVKLRISTKTDEETRFNESRALYIKGNDVFIMWLVFISVSLCIHIVMKSEKIIVSFQFVLNFYGDNFL